MNIELHEHLMRFTVDTFKRETDKLKAQISKLALQGEVRYEMICNLQDWLEKASNSLLAAGYERTPTNEWKPPLGKRPDFEGADVIKASIEMFRASAVVQQAMQRYEEARK